MDMVKKLPFAERAPYENCTSPNCECTGECQGKTTDYWEMWQEQLTANLQLNTELNKISKHNRAIIKDLKEQREQMKGFEIRIQALLEQLKERDEESKELIHVRKHLEERIRKLLMENNIATQYSPTLGSALAQEVHDNEMLRNEVAGYEIRIESLLNQIDVRENELTELQSRIASLEAAEQKWIKTGKMPDFDGKYLCHIVKLEKCEVFSKYQRVVNCISNKWVLEEGERVTHWQKLPQPPSRTVKLMEPPPSPPSLSPKDSGECTLPNCDCEIVSGNEGTSFAICKYTKDSKTDVL
jgi:hypothetical protein